MSPDNIVRHELIGMNCSILDSEVSSYNGLTGTIVDETKKTLRVDVGGCVKTIPKDAVSLRLKLPNGLSVVVDGSLLHGRPEERLVRRT